MKNIFFLVVLLFVISISAGCQTNANNVSIVKLEMSLSAFGVESDDYPNIDGLIDFEKDSAQCKVWYFAPQHKNSEYSLSKNEIKEIRKLLQNIDLEKTPKKYTSNRSDQPTSTLKIITGDSTYVISDYGLQGEEPLKKIYSIIYKTR